MLATTCQAQFADADTISGSALKLNLSRSQNMLARFRREKTLNFVLAKLLAANYLALMTKRIVVVRFLTE